ncbi:hypothetical protein ACFOY2_43805 [Nonomuraea purpurea]|uniref:Uncharacterized protein n=1 Tax=Nonomuraea purpurea TaxID=1849276 RepID=A0ABV8GMT5_9ACTN
MIAAGTFVPVLSGTAREVVRCQRRCSPRSNWSSCARSRRISAYRDAGYFDRNVRTIEVLIDRAALDQLLERLADVPTPSGATPHQIGVPAQATLLPVIAVNQKPT